ncbi:conserved hypothetical protein [Vibrio chagasii]|nr:conserved hypothetical protein [Vibrio chagasii]
MHLHITPRIFEPSNGNVETQLVDVSIPELGLTLVEGKDLVARRPYRNKRYLVASRKIGRKAIAGILIKTQAPIHTYTVITRWSVNASEVLTHTALYNVIDTDFEATTDNSVMWSAMCDSLGGFGSRIPEQMNLINDGNQPPSMEIIFIERTFKADDTVSNGIITERTQSFDLPTVEPERLTCHMAELERYPLLEHAFLAN